LNIFIGRGFVSCGAKGRPAEPRYSSFTGFLVVVGPSSRASEALLMTRRYVPMVVSLGGVNSETVRLRRNRPAA